MRTYVVALYLICVSRACKACDPGWSSFADSCYKYFSERKTWSEAKVYCESQKAHLAIVTSYEENDFLKAMLRNLHLGNDQAWMDGDDLKTENGFVWENTGEGFEVTDWSPNEPNQSGGDEDCVSFYGVHDFKWNDSRCQSRYGFLCERDLPQHVVG